MFSLVAAFAHTASARFSDTCTNENEKNILNNNSNGNSNNKKKKKKMFMVNYINRKMKTKITTISGLSSSISDGGDDNDNDNEWGSGNKYFTSFAKTESSSSSSGIDLLRPFPGLRAECGNSRYAQRLRDSRRAVAKDESERHCLVVGEPGTLKVTVAKLAHYQSKRKKERAIFVQCGRLATFGGKNSHDDKAEQHAVKVISNAFNNVARGQVILFKDVDALPYGAQSFLNEKLSKLKPSEGDVRLFMTASAPPNIVTKGLKKENLITIRTPPLRVRRSDLESEAKFMLREISIEQDDLSPKAFTKECIRALQAYDWPGNQVEMHAILERAVLHLRTKQSEVNTKNELKLITEQIVWPGALGKQRQGVQFRFDLFDSLPWMRTFARSKLWNGLLQQNVVVPAFIVVNAFLIFGPQTRDANVFLNVFWAWWWPGILITYPLVGRSWCAICPFMACGEKVQVQVAANGVTLRSWPHDKMDRFGGLFLVGLFFFILLWEELWLLENHARLSSALLLLITLGAVIGSLYYEKRIWCRHLCPIGGMNGMFAKLSAIELRAKEGVCAAECTSYGCFKGGPAVLPQGMKTDGCPVQIHPAHIKDNKDCVMCGHCVQACPHESISLNLRPPGIDLWTTNEPKNHEIALLFLLLGATFCHRLTESAHMIDLIPFERSEAAVLTTAQTVDDYGGYNPFSSPLFRLHSQMAVIALMYPGTIAIIAHFSAKVVNKITNKGGAGVSSPKSFVEESYAYLPLCWLALLAHFLDLGLSEAGRVLPVTAKMFGFETLALSGQLPELVADDHVIAFLQGACILAGCSWSVVLLRFNTSKWSLAILPQSFAIVLLSWQYWQVIVSSHAR